MEETNTVPSSTPSVSPLSLAALCFQLPKAELHAHLHGSIRPSTLAELVATASSSPSASSLVSSLSPSKYEEAMHVIQNILPLNHRSLSDCFKIFDVIHSVVNTPAIVERITREMIDDCVKDNIRYVEIRTTPRTVSSGHTNGSANNTGTTRYINLPPGAWYEEEDSSSSFSRPIPVHSTVANAEATSIDCGYELDRDLNEYVETVIHTVSKYYTETYLQPAPSSPPILIRLLFSLNRTSPLSLLEKIIQLTLVWSRVRLPWLIPSLPSSSSSSSSSSPHPLPSSHKLVIGMDISGDPTRGNLSPILDLLDTYLGKTTYDDQQQTYTHQRSLPVTVHAGEVMNIQETATVLRWLPNRLGHMCVLNSVLVNNLLSTLTRDNPTVATTASQTLSPRTTLHLPFPVPIELCPTSNALTLHLPSLHHHPTLSPWLENNYPISICTDDSGVFNVTLSSEYTDVAETYALRPEQIIRLAEQGFRITFAEKDVQVWMMEQVKEELRRLSERYPRNEKI